MAVTAWIAIQSAHVWHHVELNVMIGGQRDNIYVKPVQKLQLYNQCASTMDKVSYHRNHIVSDRAHDFIFHGGENGRETAEIASSRARWPVGGISLYYFWDDLAEKLIIFEDDQSKVASYLLVNKDRDFVVCTEA
jgi:hypothetical protein